jgi:uncharacterized coiled-coil DUF342 family protein
VLQSQLSEHQSSVEELKQKLAQTVSELSTSVRALQQVQAELKTATRRAEEAEKAQADLQAEGIGLMRSLEEMRPKIVELTDAKLNLGEKVDSLNNAVRARDDTIAQLEGTIEELREKHAQAEAEHRNLSNSLEKERLSTHENASELQKAYTDIQKELQDARASLDTLEAERSEYHHIASQRGQEVDRLNISLHTHIEQLNALQAELDERKRAADDSHDVLERTRAELEALHAELTSKDNELARLQQSAPAAAPHAGHALDEEILGTLRQQHALELSAAQSEIRRLEGTVYDADARAHAAQRQAAALEDQLTHLRGATRSSPRPPHASIASTGARPPSRLVDHSDDLRRASFGSARSSAAPGGLRPLSPPSSFEGLSAETRHRRRVSLGMLKARIDSEAAAAASSASVSSRASPAQRVQSLPTVVEPASSAPGTPRAGTPGVPSAPMLRKTQFLDDSHIFWCHSCRGDLVIL